MHDSFESLLSRCRRYHRKQMLKRAGWAFLFFGGVTAIAVMSLQNRDVSSELERVAITVQPVTLPTEHVVEPPRETPRQLDVSEDAHSADATAVSTTPVPVEMKKHRDIAYNVAVDERYLLDYTASRRTTEQETKPVPPDKMRQEISEKTKNVQIPVSAIVPSDEQALKMSTKKLASVEDLIAQQEKEPRYELALKIAEFYYDDAKYSQASLWSKKANMLDKEAEGAWIVYAKSEYARGNRERAIDILSLYLANKNSKEAEMLLMTWRQGK